MESRYSILTKLNLFKIRPLSSILILCALLAGCNTPSSAIPSSDNTVTLSQERRIILKQGRVIQDTLTNDNLWSRVREGFQLQNEYLKNSNYRIKQQQQQMTTYAKTTEQLLAKSNPYLFYIVEQLEARNMPLELALLPAVESAYDPTASSHMKAAGLWQFMPKTANHFNLQQTRWYDGRKDIISSTNAALDYLQYLHNSFKDWSLALAAYNAGEGTVRRAISQNQKQNLPTDYWHLTLPKETTTYVPKLLALSKIIALPNNHQIKIRPIANKPYFEKVDIHQQVKLSTIASLIGVENEELKKLNPGLIKQAIIQNKSPKRLLIPIEKKSLLIDILVAGNIPNDNIPLWNSYSIKRGDTLSSIATRHKITINELKQINQLSNNQTLKIGHKLKVPMIAMAIPKIERPTRTIVLKDNSKYTIKAGDSLWSISRKNNIEPEKLLKLNQLSADASLKPGQQLYLSDRN